MPKNPYNLTPSTLKGMLPSATGDVIFVDSATGNASGDGSSLRPFNNLENALNKSGLSSGDTILIMEGHAETISGAAGAAIDVAGVAVIGLGIGNKRPTFSFSATDSTITMTAASCMLKNIITKATIDNVVSCIVVSAAGCTIDIEHQDTSSTVEATRAILTTAGADNLNIKLIYKGFTGGNGTVNAIRLVGVDTARIDVDFYGVASTAVVEFVTTACTNIVVKGYFYNSGTTDLSKNVVDTAGSGTWFVDGYDGAAGSLFSGGSGQAIAASDLSTMAADIVTIKANTGGTDGTGAVLGADDADNQFASTNVVANRDGSVLERLEHILDCIVDDETTNALGVNDADNAFVSSSVVANADGSILERLEYLQVDNLAVPRAVEKADGAVLSGTDDLFTITGGPVKILEITGIVTTAIGAGTTNVKLQITTTEPAATVDMSAAAVDIDADAAGTSYQTINTTGIFTPVTAGYVKEANSFATLPTTFLAPIGTIKFNSDAARSGNIKWYLRYVPLSENSRVVAAA